MLKTETFERFLEITRIMQIAVSKVQQSHRENGIPNVYSKNGRIVWELPDGTYVYTNPLDNQKECENSPDVKKQYEKTPDKQ